MDSRRWEVPLIKLTGRDRTTIIRTLIIVLNRTLPQLVYHLPINRSFNKLLKPSELVTVI